MLMTLKIWSLIALLLSDAEVDPYQALPSMAKLGKTEFDTVAEAKGDTMEGMAAVRQSNPLQFSTLTDFWCAWELTDRKRNLALLIDDMQVEYGSYVRGIVPQTKLLIDAFREAGLPIFWSTWWRWGPDDGFFNSMDRFYGPVGWRTAGNALYNHNLTHGGDVLDEVAPINDVERTRVMHKSYSLDMFDERPMKWLVPNGQGTLHGELQKLGVDTVVQLGAWTDDCIISTAFHAFSLQYDVVLVEDGVSTASKQHFNAVEVLRGAAAKVVVAQEVADYVNSGQPVINPTQKEVQQRMKSMGVRTRSDQGKFQRDRLRQNAGQSVELATPPVAAVQATTSTSLPVICVVLMTFVGPASFIAGWVLRGRTLNSPQTAAFLG